VIGVIVNTAKIANRVYYCSVCGHSSIHSSSCQFCILNEEVVSMSKITFIRNEKGDFVKGAVGVTKTIVNATVDVVRLYTDLIRGSMDLLIRVGLLWFFWPFIVKFLKVFYELLSQIAGGGM
jgi:hypothetical protein